MKDHIWWVVGSLFFFSIHLTAIPTTINFEAGNAPGFTPTNGLVITNQFEQSHGVIFNNNSGSPAVHIVQTGGTAAAFGSSAGNDTLLSGQPNIGSFFIAGGTDSNFAAPFDFTLTFTQGVKHVSGLFFDLEVSSERITAQIFNQSGAVLQTVTQASFSPTGDGIATPWSFDRSSDDIFSLRIQAFQTSGGLIGTGIDNITIDRNIPLGAAVPEANSLLLLLSAGTILAFRGKK